MINKIEDETRNKDNNNKSKNCNIKLIGIIAVIILIAVGVGLGVMLSKKNHDNPPSNDNNSASNDDSKPKSEDKPSFEKTEELVIENYIKDLPEEYSDLNKIPFVKAGDVDGRFVMYDGLANIVNVFDGYKKMRVDPGYTINPTYEIKQSIPKHGSTFILNGEETSYTMTGSVASAAHYSSIKDSNDKIGIMVAGNSGMPWGALGLKFYLKKYEDIHPGYKTQEESVIEEWLKHEGQLKYEVRRVQVWDKKSGQYKESLRTEGTDFTRCIELWNICRRKWGFDVSDPDKYKAEEDLVTIQGINYKSGKYHTNPKIYEQAWVVRDAQFGKYHGTDINIEGSLIFVAGPNARNDGQNPKGSMFRTKNLHCFDNEYTPFVNHYKLGDTISDESVFARGIKYALRSGLDAMIREGINIAIVARISTGIYAGTDDEKDPFRKQAIAQFPDWLQQVLDETVIINDGKENTRVKRGQMFKAIDLPDIENNQ